MVFLTDSGDFNLDDTQMALATFQHAGAAGVRLMLVEGMGHELPPAASLDEALAHLDGGAA